MARTRFAADRGLSARMGFVMFLLGLLYVVFVGVLIAIHLSPILIVVIAGGFFLFQFFGSDRIALYAMHGHIVTPEEAPELHAIIDRLCALSNRSEEHT